MSDAHLILIAMLCGFLGMAWFALAKKSHWQQLRGKQPLTPQSMTALRVSGTVGILTSLILCFRADHPTMAVLVWIMGLTCAALLVTFLLSWQPSWLRPLLFWIPKASS
ncbi:DUF3325 domain-containing protein [Ketobacter sp. MCCC 1A13808]|uniref:DUF3325 domain-containing protein n=1 Tax=Ketobacter sp. MCCC 1A13808 TaxID=2602738 RepID=UPI000F233709|nr:DUF3325 domain-containing protein [Ketobacter sp. MCCC 1A13808]MVF11508.1 DUF3325 domain-containing protein [Ketobacter sp. MCCC 1A13808]RLP53286.1 MAG: DUF3325 domain-containing protein [Ketobacter sp.]